MNTERRWPGCSQWNLEKIDAHTLSAEEEDDEIADVFGDLGELPTFVITAY